MVAPPQSSSERWDAVAHAVRLADGDWVVVGDWPSSRRGGRNELVRQALARRGLTVEVRSRRGGAPDRPWTGWRTWARMQ